MKAAIEKPNPAAITPLPLKKVCMCLHQAQPYDAMILPGKLFDPLLPFLEPFLKVLHVQPRLALQTNQYELPVTVPLLFEI